MSKFSDKMAEAQDIARATALLEQLNTRLSVGGRNWREKQTQDWCALRQIANNQIARAELLESPVPTVIPQDDPAPAHQQIPGHTIR